MSKTAFTDNVSRIYAAFLNSIFGTGADGGHVHDGVNSDGHCGKINFFTHITNNQSSSIAVKITASELTTQQLGYISYERHNGFVIMYLPQLIGTSNANTLTIKPQTGLFPPEILPTNYPQIVRLTLRDDGVPVPGIMFIGADEWNCWCLPAAANGVKLAFGVSNFKTSGGKGIYGQSISYQSDII